LKNISYKNRKKKISYKNSKKEVKMKKYLTKKKKI